MRSFPYQTRLDTNIKLDNNKKLCDELYVKSFVRAKFLSVCLATPNLNFDLMLSAYGAVHYLGGTGRTFNSPSLVGLIIINLVRQNLRST